jgi:hypothetical protein
MAGHVRLELRNVAKNYPFETSHRFSGILANSSPRDYSRLSCGGARPQLGPSAGDLREHSLIEAHRRHCKNFPEMIRRRQVSDTIAHFALDFSRQESVCGVTASEPDGLLLSTPPAPFGLRGV